MFCPSCRVLCSASSSGCAACGFHFGQVQGWLGSHQVSVDSCLIDQPKALRLAEFQALERHLDEFERRFPQVTMVVFLGDLPPTVDPSLAGIWLLNQATLRRRGLIRSAAYGVAIILDPRRGAAGIAVGYALESALSAPILHAIISEVRPHLLHQEYGRAVRRVVAAIGTHLSKLAKSRPRQIPSVSAPVAPSHLGLEKAQPSPRPSAATPPRHH